MTIAESPVASDAPTNLLSTNEKLSSLRTGRHAAMADEVQSGTAFGPAAFVLQPWRGSAFVSALTAYMKCRALRREKTRG
jgi:hypothetical protein